MSKVAFQGSSFLAPYLRRFLTFRRDHQFVVSRAHLSTYHALDRYAVACRLQRWSHLDERFARAWMYSVASHAPETKNHRLCRLRVFCSYLVRLGILRTNPSLGVRLIKYQRRKPYPFTIWEIGLLLQEADRLKDRRRADRAFMGWAMSTLFYLLYACGLRISEALKLQVKDVDLEENSISLWGTKFHKERWIPISPETAERLRIYLAKRAETFPRFHPLRSPVFCHKKGAYDYRCVNKHFRHLLGRCGLLKPARQGPRIHDIRHAFATHLLYKWYQDGHAILNKLPYLSTYMGHVGVESTQVYLTITEALLREGDMRFREKFEDIPKDTLRKVLRDDWIP